MMCISVSQVEVQRHVSFVVVSQRTGGQLNMQSFNVAQTTTECGLRDQILMLKVNTTLRILKC